VPDHPWVYKEDVDALAPISPKHNPKCQCAGYQRCASKEGGTLRDLQDQNLAENVARAEEATRRAEEALLAAPAPLYSSPYTHNVDTCACGNCHKSRVDSGTQDAYYKRCKEASAAALAALPAKMEAERLKRQESYQQEQQKACGGGSITRMLDAAANVDIAIAKASEACGGSTGHPDFAKQLFAAMGTPHDSTCPHGLPFYSCMPCSH
jgi:hypothetical protein